MKKLLFTLLLLPLASCTMPDASNVKVIVGAKLLSPAIDYSVIVIENGKFTAVGPQSQVPVPKGSAITKGLGMTAEPEPGGEGIAVGKPANLILKGEAVRRMHNGEWVQP
jgi:hypothetical protein